MCRQETILNQDFTYQVEQVEIKLDKVEVILSKVFQRVRFTGRENQILPHLHEVLALCSSVFEKMNTEAARIGLIKRKLVPPQAQQFATITDLANTVNLQF